MNNIDFIKKCCEFAEGFRITTDEDYEEYIEFPNKAFMGVELFQSDSKDPNITEIYYPLLLQRAIEGVNKNIDIPFYFVYDFMNWEVYNDTGYLLEGWCLENIDEAKRTALEYVFERINK